MSNYLALSFFNFLLFKIHFIVIIRIIFIIFFKIAINFDCLNFSMSMRFLLNIKIFIRLIFFFLFLIYKLYFLSIRSLIIIIFWRRLNLLYLLHFNSFLIFLTICWFFWDRLTITFNNYFIKNFIINICFNYWSLIKRIL